ncbi:MAG: molybdopterin converting factor subunit 1 [Bdellovibrionales bacterium]|nr:molybdopterin converting factor subunit 1 [Bdellovibrionales bacterium]
MNLTIKYYAFLRDKAGVSSEVIDVDIRTAEELYNLLNEKYQFQIDKSQLRVAVNDEFVDFNTSLVGNDKVVFIPPVAGG